MRHKVRLCDISYVPQLELKYSHFPDDRISSCTVPPIFFLLPITLFSIRVQYSSQWQSETDFITSLPHSHQSLPWVTSDKIPPLQ